MTLRKKLYELLKEKKVRVTVRKPSVPKEDEAMAARDWLEFRNLSDEEIKKKLERLPESEMLKLYKKLEREVGLRIDPLNYRPHVIVNNFILLWTRKKEDERKAAAAKEKFGEPLEPLSGDEVDQVMSNRGRGRRGISGPATRISK